MSNHYHLVLKLSPCEAETWSDDEVLHRWSSLHKGMPLVQKYLDGKPLLAVEREAVHSCAAVYRKRLQSLSWFMKRLNEPIARQANKEDGCTGHFYKTHPVFYPPGRLFRRSKSFQMILWEARFKSQALFTEDALLSAMAYVDLNPVRARMANTPEDSDFTSIKGRSMAPSIAALVLPARQRIEPQFDLAVAITQQTNSESLRHFDLPLKPIAKFEGNLKLESQTGIIFGAADYLSLVDTTGRIIRTGTQLSCIHANAGLVVPVRQRGAIFTNLPPILARLNLDVDAWLIRTQSFERHYHELFSKHAIRSKAA